MDLDSTPVAAQPSPALPRARRDAAAATDPGRGWPRSFTARFAQLAAQQPDRPAFAAAGRELTYRQAHERAALLARALLRRLDGREGPVAVLVGSSVDGLTALLAAALAGRVVVPLDAQLPAARLREVCAAAGVAACLTDGTRPERAGELAAHVPDVVGTAELLRDGTGAHAPGAPGAPAGELPDAAGSGADPLLVVFTSGSTGRPKGVLLTHDWLLSAARTARERFGVVPEDRVALVLPPSFAAGAVVLATALLNGACTWLLDPREHGARAVAEGVRRDAVTTFHATPHLLRSVLAAVPAGAALTTLRLVTTAGEAVHGRDVEQLAARVRPGTEFFNWPGSSETGPISSFRVVCGEPVPQGALPAGLPEPGKDVSVLLPDGTPAPAGGTGEVFVTSSALAAGYWGDPERTAERFSTAPDGRRTYRTGDLGRLDADGTLHLLGRFDGAVKVRGYLVHLAEVEAALLASPAVAEAVVVAVEAAGTHRLVAYVAPVPGEPVESPAALRRRLRAHLPEYMVPADVVPLTALPHNERGKVDRGALPPVPPRAPSEPPSTDTEVRLARLWSELLGLEGTAAARVGREDDFQQLGADSLTVEEMLARVEEGFGVELLAGDLLEAPTLREFARRVAAGPAALPRHPTAVALRAPAAAPVLFCFAGAGALGMSFTSLAAHLPGRAVVAFQARGSEARALPDLTVAAAARRHLRELRLVQPRGPYVLVGHSMGGLVALEVARRLREAGEEVASVVLVDTYLPRTAAAGPGPAAGPGEPGGSLEPGEPEEPGERLEPGGPGGPAVSGGTGGAAGASRRARGPLRAVLERVLPDGLPPLHAVPQRLRVPLAGVVRFGPRQGEVMHDHGHVVARRHRVQPYAGRAVCVQLLGNPDGPAPWRGLLTGPHEFLHLECDHNSVLRDPHAADLAAVVGAELRAAVR